MTHFHNSLHLPDVKHYEAQALKQDQQILNYLKDRPNVRYTARRLHREVFSDLELNSVRRGLTNMVTAGHLTHHNKKEDLVPEVKGKPNTTYSYQAKGQLKIL